MNPALPDLLARAQGGDRAAMAALLEGLAPVVHRFGMRLCRHPQDAEDVVQDTLLAVAQHVGDFAGRSALQSWVFALARSACNRKRRGLKNQPAADADSLPEPVDVAPTPEQAVLDGDLAARIDRAMSALPDDYREVVALRDVEGYSAQEAAAAIGISVDALKSRLHRARTALRQALLPILESEAPAPRPSCPNVIELLWRKLEGELAPADCLEMERHVDACPSCGPACLALKRALSVCSTAAADGPLPEAVQVKVQAAVRAALGAWERGLS